MPRTDRNPFAGNAGRINREYGGSHKRGVRKTAKAVR